MQLSYANLLFFPEKHHNYIFYLNKTKLLVFKSGKSASVLSFAAALSLKVLD